jgi:hypothetical protein
VNSRSHAAKSNENDESNENMRTACVAEDSDTKDSSDTLYSSATERKPVET